MVLTYTLEASPEEEVGLGQPPVLPQVQSVAFPGAVTPSAEHHDEEAASQALHRGILCLHVSSWVTAVRGCRTAGAGLKPSFVSKHWVRHWATRQGVPSMPVPVAEGWGRVSCREAIVSKCSFGRLVIAVVSEHASVPSERAAAPEGSADRSETRWPASVTSRETESMPARKTHVRVSCPEGGSAAQSIGVESSAGSHTSI